jgi:hypothetical protein
LRDLQAKGRFPLGSLAKRDGDVAGDCGQAIGRA